MNTARTVKLNIQHPYKYKATVSEYFHEM